MKTKYLDFLNETVDYSKFINNNELTIENKEIDLKDLAIEKYKDLTKIKIENCTVLNQETDFSIFQNLKTLDCENNQLVTLPDLANCRQLTRLWCENNQLTKLPDLANCRQLTRLRCENNQLTKLPDLSNCSQLEWLSCTNNQLTTLPDLNNCSQLQYLYCDNNQLTSCKSFYSVYKSNFNISNNPIPQIEVEFIKNESNIVNYYFNLFNYCVENNRKYKDFMEIEWPEDFYDNYISKATTPKQKRYMNYFTHDRDFGSSIDGLFSFD